MAVRCSEADGDLRAEIVAEARRWIGTPYVHQASCLGAGTDCLGLVRGIWRSVYGQEPELVPAYGAGWGEVGRDEVLLEASQRHLTLITSDAMAPGDMLLFRMRQGAPAKHLALLVEGSRMIHAYSGHAVLEGDFSEGWRRRLCATFRFPKRG